MKKLLLAKNLVFIFASVLLLTACEPKNEPRWEHEGAQTWKPTATPDQPEVKASSFNNFDLARGYAQIKESGADLTSQILQPLAKIILNREFIEKPVYRTTRLQQLINVFNAAFVIEYKKNPQNPAFAKIKQDYRQTVFAECTQDLKRDCRNASLFATDGRHTLIMTLFAKELDAPIEAALKTAAAANKNCIQDYEQCRNLIEERYRLLAMGVYKANRYQDPDYSFAYIKYARMFSSYLETVKATPPPKGDNHGSMSFSYLADVHTKIFETIIAKYKPTDLTDPEFRSFVENFNPWGYSRKQADLFQYGTAAMFDLAAQCCLYKDAGKTQLNKSVTDAIAQSQSEKDNFGLSFKQIVAEIRKEHGDRIFAKMGIADLVHQIDRADGAFFNEYFFIVDRLFRGHLSTDEVEKMLINTNPQRARTELPKMITGYVKIYLVYMTQITNHVMSDLYHSDVASDRIFQQAVTQSREITGRWYTAQAQIELLEKLMNSYFRDRMITSPEYESTFSILKAVNRNIHYIAAFPHAIVMNYFLSKKKGTLTFESWYGKVEVRADTIVKDFFDGGQTEPWFRFGKDTESMDRLMLLYSFEFLLSTESLDSFVAKDAQDSATETSDRAKFFSTIFTKYLGEDLNKMLQDVQEFEQSTVGNFNFAGVKEICSYEMENNGLSRRQEINFTELDRYTYSGLEDNSVNKVMSDFLGNSSDAISTFLSTIENRKAYVRTMVDVIEGDLLRSGAIKIAGESHPDLDPVRDILKKLDETQVKVTQLFVSRHKATFDCALKLREIERRRANRLYDEEREHLGKVYDLLKPLSDITDDVALNVKVKEINAQFFTQEKGYRFDRLDGMTYRMSKYDLLMRMKNRIESDIFVNPTEKERKFYGASLNAFIKPRSVSVYIPEGIQRNDMWSQGTNTGIRFGGTTAQDREAFIKDGMANLSGAQGSFIGWKALQRKDNFLAYLRGLEAFYLLPPAPGTDPKLIVSAKDLADAYISIMASYFMDPYDVEYSQLFNSYGRHDKTFYQGILFERDGMTHLPLFYNLMDDTIKMASVDLTQKGGVVFEALDFAKRFNSMQAFLYEPSPVIKNSVYAIYGERAHYRLNKVSDLFAHLSREAGKYADATGLDARFAQPIYLEGDAFTRWYQPGAQNLMDTQRFQDHKVGISDFIQRSGNFYGTKEKVKVP